MKSRLPLSFALPCVAALLATGCSNKKDQERIKSLETEIETLNADHEQALEEKNTEIESKREELEKAGEESAGKITDLTKERDDLANEVDELKQEVRRLKSNDLDRAQDSGRASANPKPAANPATNPAIANAMATITGSGGKVATGFVVDDGGKRYLYALPGALGTPPFTVANAAGTRFTKFGDVESAAGSKFIRIQLEDAADVPALKLAEAGANPDPAASLYILSLQADGKTVVGDQVSATRQNGETLGVSAGLITGKAGAPVVDAATGQALAIITAPVAQAAAGIWGDPAAGGGGSSSQTVDCIGCSAVRRVSESPENPIFYASDGGLAVFS